MLIEIIDETDFYTLTWTSQQVYQYNKASDLWVLLDYTDWDYEYEIKDFSGKEILSGTFAFSSYCSYQYKVVIDSVDTENETMTGDVWIRDQYCDCLRIIEDTVFDLALGNMGYYSYIPALVIELEKYEHPGCWGMSYGDLPLVDQA